MSGARAGERGIPMEVLKWTALGLMVFDHVAALSYPQDLLLRFPGRFVFPVLAGLMATHLAKGYPPNRYLSRLLPFALAAQPVYAWTFGTPTVWPLNALFTLLAGALMVRGHVLTGGALSLFTEYPFGGAVVYFWTRGEVLWGVMALLASYALFGWSPVVLPLIAGVSVVGWYAVQKGMPGSRLPWWVGYVFYPGHLLIVGLLFGGA